MNEDINAKKIAVAYSIAAIPISILIILKGVDYNSFWFPVALLAIGELHNIEAAIYHTSIISAKKE